jgi:hypothetical protein
MSDGVRRPNPPTAGWPSRLPWIDGFAGLVAGLLVITLLDFLTRLYSIPRQTLIFIAAANLGYPVLGFSLGFLRERATSVRRGLLAVLIVANLGWALTCIVLALRFGRGASVFGLAHLIGEAILVAALATLEWRHRRIIVGEPPSEVRATQE